MQLPSSYDPLKQFRQWAVRLPGDKKPVLLSTMSSSGWNTKPELWASYDEVAASGMDYGFILTADDQFVCVDLDHCYDKSTGQWNETARDVMLALDGACMEWSQSGEGAHIFGYAHKPPYIAAQQNSQLGGVYFSDRFIAITGNEIRPNQGTAGHPIQAPIEYLLHKYIQTTGRPGVASTSVDWTDYPSHPDHGARDVDEAVRVLCGMRSGRATFGTTCPPVALYNGDTDILAEHFPPQSDGEPYDRSAADQALANHLAFVTASNCELMRSVMLASGLARHKWDQRPGYLDQTIRNAVAVCKTAWTRPGTRAVASVPPPPAGVPAPPGTSVTPGEHPQITGAGIMGIPQQIEWFQGYHYVTDRHEILTPKGQFIGPNQFCVERGGYDFIVTTEGKTTKNAFEAFTNNRAHRFKHFDVAVFRPDLPFQAEIVHEGLEAINRFIPRFGKRIPGDVSLYQRHMENFYPVESDRNYFEKWLAGIVQFPGTKFQWAPVIQGVQGNGKTFFYELLRHIVGAKYTHKQDPNDLDNKFNGWIADKLVVCIDEIRAGGNSKIADILKPMITNDDISFQAKGQDQMTAQSCANFILMSNHKDAVPITQTERRYAVFFTGQQTLADLATFGMNRDYFRTLYDWAHYQDGYAKVTDYLSKLEIDKYYLTERAPWTTSMNEAISASLDRVESRISDAIETDVLGFREGLISLTMAHEWVNAAYKTVSSRRVASALRKLGFVLHPILDTLPDKRIKHNGTRLTLYVDPNSTAFKIESKDDLINFYNLTLSGQ